MQKKINFDVTNSGTPCKMGLRPRWIVFLPDVGPLLNDYSPFTEPQLISILTMAYLTNYISIATIDKNPYQYLNT